MKKQFKKTILITGCAGFIPHALGKRLKKEGYYIIGADIKSREEASEYCKISSYCHKYYSKDLSIYDNIYSILKKHPEITEIYSMACLMGGATFVFTGEHDAQIISESVALNLNLLRALQSLNMKCKVFYSGSACCYPESKQETYADTKLSETLAWQGKPDSAYGVEKLFSEQLYLNFHKQGLIEARIARYHNIFGEEGTWYGGKEKAPAALARKIALASNGDEIEILGTGQQVRSFLYVDECLDATIKLMESDFVGPVNIGSEEAVSINDLAKMIIKISGKDIKIKNIPSNAIGVMGRNSDNTLIREKLGWDYKQTLEDGLKKLYPWIVQQVDKKKLNKE